MLARIIWVTAREDATPEALPKMSYDDLGRPIEIKDAKGKSTFYNYDAASRVKGVTDANGNATGYNYTTSGDLSLIEIIEMTIEMNFLTSGSIFDNLITLRYQKRKKVNFWRGWEF